MENHTNHLITEDISKLIKKIAIPASVGFFFNTMYNVVDSYFAGLVSTDALAALSLSFPVFFLIIAFGSGLSSAVTALVAHALGEGDRESAKEYAVQGFSFAIVLSVVMTAAGTLIAPTLFRLLGATDQYLTYSTAYISVIFAGTIFFVLTFLCNAILSAVGDTKSFRNFLIAGFFANFVFNYWFMFGGFGVPAFGIAGIALGTVVVQCCGVMYLVHKVMQTGLITRESIKHILPRAKAYKEINAQGLPASFSMLTIALGVFIITYFISGFGKAAVAAYGIATRIEQIALLPLIGLNIAAMTLVGQNRGAKKHDRVVEAIKKVMKYALSIATVGVVFVFTSAGWLMGMFTDDVAVIATGSQYLRIAACIMWAYAILFTSDSVFRGLKMPMFSLWLGLFRQIIGPVGLFSLMIYVLHTSIVGVWWSVFAIAWASALISLWYLRRVIQRLS